MSPCHDSAVLFVLSSWIPWIPCFPLATPWPIPRTSHKGINRPGRRPGSSRPPAKAESLTRLLDPEQGGHIGWGLPLWQKEWGTEHFECEPRERGGVQTQAWTVSDLSPEEGDPSAVRQHLAYLRQPPQPNLQNLRTGFITGVWEQGHSA